MRLLSLQRRSQPQRLLRSAKVDSIDTKASSIVHATDGINTGLRETIAAQQTTAEHLAVVNNYRAQIAELTKKVNGGT
jgi:hypothetical protein